MDVQDWKTQHFAREVSQKSIIAEVGLLMMPGSFFMSSGGSGINFHVVLAFQVCFMDLGAFEFVHC